jgi:phosphoglycerate dehydrogenase-like enzyme
VGDEDQACTAPFAMGTLSPVADPMTARRMTSILLPRFLLDGHRSQLETAALDRAELLADDHPSLAEAIPAELEIVVTGIDGSLLDRAISAPGVRWVHSVSAGVEHLPLERMAERGTLLTNSAGAYAPAMAEYAIAGMIMLTRSIPSWLEGQRERRWLDGDSFGTTVLRGKRLGIVGYGAVGRELATVAQALGMEVWATKRSPLFLSAEPLDRLLAASELPDLLAASDVVVLCASLNSSTRHLIGAAELAVMKPTAVLVNVARGGLVDEDALVHALRNGRLRGAMLDVTTEEPLATESPLWTAPNLYITPHISGNTPESWHWQVEFFCRNLRLYLEGSPERMGNLVDYPAVG